MEIGTRIIFDTQTGKVLNGTFGEMEGDIQSGLRPEKIDFIDLPFGYNENNFRDADLYRIDISKPKTAPIVERIVIDSYIKHEPSQADVLGQALAQMKLKNIHHQSVIDGLGAELTQSRLDNTLQKQHVDSLGAELTKANLEIIDLKGERS